MPSADFYCIIHSMKFAVIKASGTQIKVFEGEEVDLDRLDKEKGDKIEFDEVLLFSDDKKIEVGKPLLKKVKVVAEAVEHFKGKKLDVLTYKAKSRYRRKKGYRHSYTKVLIKSIKNG